VREKAMAKTSKDTRISLINMDDEGKWYENVCEAENLPEKSEHKIIDRITYYPIPKGSKKINAIQAIHFIHPNRSWFLIDADKSDVQIDFSVLVFDDNASQETKPTVFIRFRGDSEKVDRLIQQLKLLDKFYSEKLLQSCSTPVTGGKRNSQTNEFKYISFCRTSDQYGSSFKLKLQPSYIEDDNDGDRLVRFFQLSCTFDSKVEPPAKMSEILANAKDGNRFTTSELRTLLNRKTAKAKLVFMVSGGYHVGGRSGGHAINIYLTRIHFTDAVRDLSEPATINWDEVKLLPLNDISPAPLNKRQRTEKAKTTQEASGQSSQQTFQSNS
jgi:hypothetical protein